MPPSDTVALSGGTPRVPRRVRVSLPFWGGAYAKTAMTVTVPAMLAPGNLPALAEEFDVEVALVTESKLFPYVTSSPSYQKLVQYADVRLISLDDLLTGRAGDYGPVLSFALVRGYADLGERMLDTYLMFLTADFVLADGSWRTAARLMKQGKRIIHSPSFRAVQEEVMPALMSRIDPETNALAVPPREMVGMALAHKHITVRARIINQKAIHQWRMDQFYWYVDENTLIGYQWPIALVALWPERVVTVPKLMFDYGFIPDICPSGDNTYITDSDQFFMIEPQSRGTGHDLVRLGWIDKEAIAADLNRWTTAEHRACGQQMHVFHSADIPASLPAIAAESKTYMEDLVRRLAPPNPYDNHPLFAEWWHNVLIRQGLAVAQSNSPGKGSCEMPDNNPHTSVRTRLLDIAIKRILRPAYNVIFGGGGTLRPFHPLWLEYRTVIDRINASRGNGEKLLLVTRDIDTHVPLVGLADGAITPAQLLAGGPLECSPGNDTFDLAVILMDLDEIHGLRDLFRATRGLVRTNGTILVRVLNTYGRPVAPDDMGVCDSLPDLDICDVDYYASYGIRPLRSWYWKAARLQTSARRRLLAIAGILALTMPFNVLLNQLARNSSKRYKPRWFILLGDYTVLRSTPSGQQGSSLP